MVPRHAHKRSLSSDPRALSPDRMIPKARSTTNLADAVKQQHSNYEESNFNTLQDPRLMLPTEISPSTSSSHHPDLSNEVAALSVKLIQAINNQTTLDDNLAATRQELEVALSKVKTLESENEKYRRDFAEKIYIRKADADTELTRMRSLLAEESAQRSTAEKAKKTIEQELEALTADLFEEANKMVAAAKIEREAVEKKNEQLRSQIKDTELLLASHQDQLAELKSVMQGMNLTQEDIDARTHVSTAPPSPAAPPHWVTAATLDATTDYATSTSTHQAELKPGPTCDFPDRIRLVCRTDQQAYEEFKELLALPRNSKPPSRAGSGSYAGLNVMSLASFATGGSTSATSSPIKGLPQSPNGSMSSQNGPHVPLKDTRFYKRVLMEDIEPTLRLDLAPGISWLTRRTVLSGICEGSLIVEPIPAATKKFEFPCSTCGERRQSPEAERTHRFRTSDSESAQRYSLCLACLDRVRSCCEFTGYLRLILDGHLRAGDAEDEKEIWEETVRLRERMFWSRIAGGVVPVIHDPVEANSILEPTVISQDHLQSNGSFGHPIDGANSELRIVDVSPRPVEAATQKHGNARPATPEITSSERESNMENASSPPQRRDSVSTDQSVYEEAPVELLDVPERAPQDEVSSALETETSGDHVTSSGGPISSPRMPSSRQDVEPIVGEPIIHPPTPPSDSESRVKA
ncbi:Uncharacterized protein PECH_007563 [Penicillium ucsense]|uniref:GDP/GTP exchange factor Sec2 N-terminal domain-containing protein n=1 Tax=Penicillium ucsense TaxID=2839758 RepID=A0A8J8W5X8_9EURO|nr:Uncharacterized protein PECM_004458 [Penicillium ucsense]KAF7738860.1 Uncharacterized protein PECH_007563 [Penicillium ucsense]